ncbi:MAG: ABC transporter ATP-binding protein [Planctomycetota bacterium]|nr:ABC transporter ATP-binding protein [Planctomycetota bacterium]
MSTPPETTRLPDPVATGTGQHGSESRATTQDRASGDAALLRVTGLRKTYRLGRVDVPVLHGVDIEFGRGEWIAILGASGSGKSTLLHLIGGLDRPDKPGNGKPRATIRFNARDVASFSHAELDRYRCRDVGFVFQFYHLLPELTVTDNVLLGAMIRHGRFGYMAKRADLRKAAADLLGAFGLKSRLRHKPSQLSGGERQRVAIARALINDPTLLLADEPTGNLDRKTGAAILDVLAEIRRERGQTMLMVTHDPEIAARADRIVELVDGRVVEASG